MDNNKILNFLRMVIVVMLAGLILSLPTMWLWNWVIPDIFNLPRLDVWHALGLNLLCGILFGSKN